MARQKLIKSLNSAVEGFVYVLRTQRNMRLHFLFATLVLVLGIYFALPRAELLLLLGAIPLLLYLRRRSLPFTAPEDPPLLPPPSPPPLNKY